MRCYEGVIAAAVLALGAAGCSAGDGGTPPEAKDPRMARQLGLAVQHGTTEVVDRLLAAGAEVNATSGGTTPLASAIFACRLDMVRLLVEHGAEVNTRDRDGVTPLHLAAREGLLRTAQYLLDAGANVNARDNDGRTPLHDAVCMNDELGVLLIDAGADFSAKDKYGRSILPDAAGRGRIKTISRMIGKHVNLSEDQGTAALQWAIKPGQRETVQLLLSAGAKPNTKGAFGRTPLLIAVKAGLEPISRDLIKAGADLNVKDEEGASVAHWAARRGNLRFLRELVSAGAPVQIELGDSIVNGRQDKVRAMLAASPTSVREVDSYGWTALHWAAVTGSDEIAGILVDHGANVQAEARGTGLTPLHLAAGAGRTGVIELLIKKGAAVNPKDGRSRTPLHWAAEGGHADACKVMIARGAEVNPVDRFGFTPLYLAARAGEVSVLKTLCMLGAKVRIRGDGGRTALHAASSLGKLDAVKVMLVADPGAAGVTDVHGRTPLARAISAYKPLVVEYLLKNGAPLSADPKEGAYLRKRWELTKQREERRVAN